MNISSNRWLRRGTAMFVLVALVALWAVRPAHAAETRSGEHIVIASGEVVEGDLYVAANTITVDGIIQGDLVGTANQITLNGTVEGDLLAVAQAVVVNGTIGDDARALAQAVQLGPTAQILGDVVVGGLSVESRSGSVVQGDMLVGGYQALLAGVVGHDVLGALERLELRGTIGGSANLVVSGDPVVAALSLSPAGQLAIPAVGPGLTIANGARIDGKLIYRSATEAQIAPAAQVGGGTAFEQTPVRARPAEPTPMLGVPYLQQFAGLLLAGLLLLWLAPAWTRRLSETVSHKPLPSLGWGVVAFVAFIATLIVLAIATMALVVLFGILTLGGVVGWVIVFGLLTGATLVFSYITFAAYIAIALVAYVVGRWLLQYVQPAWIERVYVPLFIGLVLYVALAAIPWLGTVVNVLAVLVALGALWQWAVVHLQHQRPHAQPLTMQPA